ncbi:LOW QUALITY PROTEIN: BLOC-2 complex member HPS6 [Leucoraja erinacea]|uniref:LOW QUALITY PROTEIN: BLOC-2 complex member HPS6 n=1 Tax=Leucoraja erinaceus TaxID=7782 RepID=UPI0024574971|nr:LOW QUALITY PROTEIN: BLOC-2 complex member HPS6 [Leucoraja erinacea]
MPRSAPRRLSGLGPWRELLLLPGARLRPPAGDITSGSGRLFLYLSRERRLLGLEPGPPPTSAPPLPPLDRRLAPAQHLLEVLELVERPCQDQDQAPGPPPTLLLTQQGRAELWAPAGGGWRLQRELELSPGPRARLLSAAWDGRALTWCEERRCGAASQRCVCSRRLGPGLELPAARLLLNNCPDCRLLAAGGVVYLLPASAPDNSLNPGNGLGNSPSNGLIPGNSPSNGLIPGNSPSNGPSNSPDNRLIDGQCNGSIHGNHPSNDTVPVSGSEDILVSGNGTDKRPGPWNCPDNRPGPRDYICNGHASSDGSYGDQGPCHTSNLDNLILVWNPQEDSWTMTSLSHGPLFTKRLLPANTDFQKLVAGAAGLLPSLPPLDLRAVSASPVGLLVAGGGGELSLVRSDGTVRLLGRLSQIPPAQASILLRLSGTTLACAVGRTVHLLDMQTGRATETTLESAPLALLSCQDTGELQALTDNGLYGLCLGTVSENGQGQKDSDYLENLVLEEACDYYQKRSLSRSRLTVERLKSEAAFRAPAVLCSVLRGRLGLTEGFGTGRGSAIDSGSGSISGPGLGPDTQAKLQRCLSGEVENYAGLEEAKRHLSRSSEPQASAWVEEIAGQEVSRLLLLPPDHWAIINLGSLAASYPAETWQALSRALQLRPAAEDRPGASVTATAEQWKALLSPPASPEQSAAFELACGLMYRFRPAWLPGFLEQAQGLATYHGRPLYKRALSALPEASRSAQMAVELLLCSQRPKAVLQAVRLLLERGLWGQALKACQRFQAHGPLLRKELFATLLSQLCHGRELDPFLPDICSLLPPDATAPALLQAMLVSLPPPEPQAGPYPGSRDILTLGLLRPLLARALEREEGGWGPEDCQQPGTLVFPPPTPPREKKAAAAAEGAC